MNKIIAGIISLILSANTYTVVYTENKVDEDISNVKSANIEEDVSLEDLSPLKGVVSTSSGTAWWTYPSDIKGVTRSGDDLLVLVNKEYQLPSTYAPSDLVSASLSGIRKGESFMLRNILIEDLKNLVSDALADGIDLSIRSGYRSYATQQSTYNYWVSYNGGSIDAADRISARPGHSHHQLGTAIDFSSAEIADGLGGSFSSTKASVWLADNAWKYGFAIGYPYGYESLTGYSYESWHYRYIGKAYAQEMHSNGMILELYLRSKN
jgi:zinc D-Ala-D-Ala carboxypeptidase